MFFKANQPNDSGGRKSTGSQTMYLHNKFEGGYVYVYIKTADHEFMVVFEWYTNVDRDMTTKGTKVTG